MQHYIMNVYMCYQVKIFRLHIAYTQNPCSELLYSLICIEIT